MKKFFIDIWNEFLDIFGFRKNSKYVTNYLNDANMRSGVFMSGVIIALELWLVIRQTNKYVISSIAGGSSPFQTIFTNLWTYFLLLSLGAAMMMYCLQYTARKKEPRRLVISIVFASISLILCCFLPFEFQYNTIRFTSEIYIYRSITKIVFYASIIAFDISIIFASIYHFKGSNKSSVSSIMVITLFALVCLMFGVMISYGDFTSTKAFKDVEGNYITIDDGVNSIAYENKGIICFLMMVIYVGCLLIWKPLISISLLGAVFIGFYLIIDRVKDFGGRRFPEGDLVNYVTFYISLVMICISIYNQRVSEANKDEELELLATKDGLTDLYAFEYFLTLVNHKIKDEELVENEWIYLFFNILGFKILNDQKGFSEGNKFLLEFGHILNESFPQSLISRQSDDHFVVFTNNVDIQTKIDRINKLTTELDTDIRLGIKVGGCVFVDKNEEARVGIEKARYACAEIGNSGCRFLKYDKEMHDNYRLAQYVVTHIDEAIEKGYIQAYYQPVVWSNGHELCGAEALARWIDPNYGFLSPGKFIPVLESSQLIYKVDLAILDLVCKKMRENIDNKIPVLPVSINFSRGDFGIIDVVKEINNIVDKYDLSHDLLHIEITESALVDDEDVLKDVVKRLHEFNYAVWLDDFGSGYSSFNVLKDYEFDVLKLDMKFLIGLETNPKAKSLIKSVIKMANEVGINTLSEGVETDEQAQFLQDISCERLQGYLYGRPLSYGELEYKIKTGYYRLSKELIK